MQRAEEGRGRGRGRARLIDTKEREEEVDEETEVEEEEEEVVVDVDVDMKDGERGREAEDRGGEGGGGKTRADRGDGEGGGEEKEESTFSYDNFPLPIIPHSPDISGERRKDRRNKDGLLIDSPIPGLVRNYHRDVGVRREGEMEGACICTIIQVLHTLSFTQLSWLHHHPGYGYTSIHIITQATHPLASKLQLHYHRDCTLNYHPRCVYTVTHATHALF